MDGNHVESISPFPVNPETVYIHLLGLKEYPGSPNDLPPHFTVSLDIFGSMKHAAREMGQEPLSKRRERGGYVYVDGTTVKEEVLPIGTPDGVPDNRIKTRISSIQNGQEQSPLLLWHTDPRGSGKTSAKTFFSIQDIASFLTMPIGQILVVTTSQGTELLCRTKDMPMGDPIKLSRLRQLWKELQIKLKLSNSHFLSLSQKEQAEFLAQLGLGYYSSRRGFTYSNDPDTQQTTEINFTRPE